ncbi:MAG: hypothetical protein JSU03_01610 [Bacteroidetes bacterium]|nr:hypothetical protein [Bacteroidota bacterium]MBS1755952.1 hypothetical protein [Bacteroidota bacterium]
MMVLFFSCKKESYITSRDARLGISADTIKFDTVFTNTGSVTRSFIISNNNSQRLTLHSVKLSGGANSPFKININGMPNEANDIDIAANDSIYVFVSITVNPSNANLPFILSDSIAINYNGNTKYVQLRAYGQNAVFLNNAVITGNTTWSNSLPYVILGSIRVDNNATLTIPSGTKVFLHGNAPFIVDGTLIVSGTITNKVIFAGDRLDDPYNKLPSSWPGIYFRNNSKDNQIKFAVIKNAYDAIVVQQPSVNANPKLTLQQSIIDNAYDAGLLCINTYVQADNCLISNCGNNINIQLGGTYFFTNCTVAAYSNIYLAHSNPVLSLRDYAENAPPAYAALNANFTNCIFWGDESSVANEIITLKKGSNAFTVNLDHCLYKATNDPANVTLSSVIKNQDPSFDSIDATHLYYNFRITKNANAPGINKGIASIYTKDLDDNNRAVGITDIGCYEKQ